MSLKLPNNSILPIHRSLVNSSNDRQESVRWSTANHFPSYNLTFGIVCRLFRPSVGFSAAVSLHRNYSKMYFMKTRKLGINLSLIHISEPTRLGMISYAVF